jgi:hypothetical protein
MSTHIEKIRATYSNVGPTADNSSRISLMKKIQVRVGGNKAQLWGLNNTKGGNTRGVAGSAGDRVKFMAIFPRFSF